MLQDNGIEVVLCVLVCLCLLGAALAVLSDVDEAPEVHVAGDSRNDHWETSGELLLGADRV